MEYVLRTHRKLIFLVVAMVLPSLVACSKPKSEVQNPDHFWQPRTDQPARKLRAEPEATSEVAPDATADESTNSESSATENSDVAKVDDVDAGVDANNQTEVKTVNETEPKVSENTHPVDASDNGVAGQTKKTAGTKTQNIKTPTPINSEKHPAEKQKPIEQLVQAPSYKKCDLLFNKRPNSKFVLEAAECWLGEIDLAKDNATKLSLFDRMFVAYAWFAVKYNNAPKGKEPVTLAATVSSLKRAQQIVATKLKSLFPNSAEYFYWSAVFDILLPQCQEKNDLLKNGTVAKISSTISKLTKAISIDRTINACGPQRVLGAIQLDLPAMFGGSPSQALSLFRSVLNCDAKTPMHYRLLAEALIRNGKKAEAKTTLERFLSMKDSDLNPNSSKESWRDHTIEVKEERAIARKLMQGL